LIVCAGILPTDVEPISQAQLLIFSSDIALATARESIRRARLKAAVAAPRSNKQTRQGAPRDWQSICIAPRELPKR
jgi:hypothetical protein